jgi:hypothetical protein
MIHIKVMEKDTQATMTAMAAAIAPRKKSAKDVDVS